MLRASSNLCHSLALVARRLCTAFVDPDNLSAFVACTLNQIPGVRPIGIGETCRRIISKAILGSDVIDAVGIMCWSRWRLRGCCS